MTDLIRQLAKLLSEKASQPVTKRSAKAEAYLSLNILNTLDVGKMSYSLREGDDGEVLFDAVGTTSSPSGRAVNGWLRPIAAWRFAEVASAFAKITATAASTPPVEPVKK